LAADAVHQNVPATEKGRLPDASGGADNSAKTKTYCIYEGPSEAAIRKAATANGLPIDFITEVPVTLLPK
jgi:hypothetical protein